MAVGQSLVSLTSPTVTLTFFDAARRALEQACTVDEVKEIRDQAEALRQYSRQARQSLEMQNDCAEIKLRAERRAGEMLAVMPKNEGGRPETGPIVLPVDEPPTLAEYGISKMQSSRWQAIAAIPTERFEAYIEETKTAQEELTTVGLLRPGTSERLAVHYSSEAAEWYTPEPIIRRVVQTLGAIDLDPCAEPARRVPAVRHYTAEEDGLAQPWLGSVYMNPPYGRAIEPWIARWVAHADAGNDAIALLPHRSDTDWWEQLAAAPIAKCEIHGRLRFGGGATGAPFPSVVVYAGDNLLGFHRAFRDLGRLWLQYDPEDA